MVEEWLGYLGIILLSLIAPWHTVVGRDWKFCSQCCSKRESAEQIEMEQQTVSTSLGRVWNFCFQCCSRPTASSSQPSGFAKQTEMEQLHVLTCCINDTYGAVYRHCIIITGFELVTNVIILYTCTCLICTILFLGLTQFCNFYCRLVVL